MSRQHCQLQVTEQVIVKDLESKFGTFVNGKRITLETLVLGDVLRCGHGVEYILKEIPIRICTSGISKADKQRLKPIIEKIGSWSDDINTCTHLLMSQITITSKVLVALSRSIPIISSEWIQGFSFKNTPLEQEYLPPLVDFDFMKLWTADTFQTNTKRKQLFQRVAFLINDYEEYKSYKDVIEASSGTLYFENQVCENSHCVCQKVHVPCSCYSDTCTRQHLFVVSSSSVDVPGVKTILADQIAKSVLAADLRILSISPSDTTSRISNTQKKPITRNESRMLLQDPVDTEMISKRPESLILETPQISRISQSRVLETPVVIEQSQSRILGTPIGNTSSALGQTIVIGETPVRSIRKAPATPLIPASQQAIGATLPVDSFAKPVPVLSSIRSRSNVQISNQIPAIQSIRSLKSRKPQKLEPLSQMTPVDDVLFDGLGDPTNFPPNTYTATEMDSANTQKENRNKVMDGTERIEETMSRNQSFSAKTQSTTQPKLTVDDFMDLLMDMGPPPEPKEVNVSSINEPVKDSSMVKEPSILDEGMSEAVETQIETDIQISEDPTIMTEGNQLESQVHVLIKTEGLPDNNEDKVDVSTVHIKSETPRLHPYVKPVVEKPPQVLLPESEIRVRVQLQPLLATTIRRRKPDFGFKDGATVPNFKRFRSKNVIPRRMISCLPTTEFHVETSFASDRE